MQGLWALVWDSGRGRRFVDWKRVPELKRDEDDEEDEEEDDEERRRLLDDMRFLAR